TPSPTSASGGIGGRRTLLAEVDGRLGPELLVVLELDGIADAGSAAAPAAEILAGAGQKYRLLVDGHEGVSDHRLRFEQGEVLRDIDGVLLDAEHPAGLLVDPDGAVVGRIESSVVGGNERPMRVRLGDRIVE